MRGTLMMKRRKMISWQPLFDGHIRGTCSRGVVWIRLNREARVTGVYLMFNSVVKLVPQLEVEETLTGAKQLAEDQLQLMDWAEELERINNQKKK